MNKLTVMTVDAQEDFRTVLSEYLEGEGFDVMTVGSGEEALQSVMFSKPNLILLEAALPGMNGFEVCRALKSNPATANIPVVFLTAKTSLGDKLNGFMSGGHSYLCKPLDLAELEHSIQFTLQYNSRDIDVSQVDDAVAFDNMEPTFG